VNSLLQPHRKGWFATDEINLLAKLVV